MPPKKKIPSKANESELNEDTDSTSSSEIGSSDENSPFNPVPSKAIADSALRFSNSKSLLERTPTKKRSLRNISVENSPVLMPLNDDSHELIEDEEKTERSPEKSVNKSTNHAEGTAEPDLSIVQTMTLEQMQEHVSRCLQLSTENKINSKNAFALRLIDCMTVMTKNEDESNFAAMACQLDAGAKIYSHRVDALHQQVIKLVDSCMFAEKTSKKGGGSKDDNSDSDDDDTNKDPKEKRKKNKKKVIATNEQISRKPKLSDPRDKFIKLEAMPGDILNKARRDPANLALSLDCAVPFWPEPGPRTSAAKSSTSMFVDIRNIELKNRRLGPVLNLDSTSMPALCPPSIDSALNQESDYPDNSCELADEFQDDISTVEEDLEDLTEAVAQHANRNPEMEMVVEARSRMTIEGSADPSRLDVIKTLFHQAGESDYHYLKMDNVFYWAGPSYWKRPQGVNIAGNKKKIVRKKKEPLAIEYTEASEKKIEKGKKGENKRTTLNPRILNKWNTKKVTLPTDILFDPKTFEKLFITDIVPEVIEEVTTSHEEENAGLDEDNVGLEDEGMERDDDINTDSAPMDNSLGSTVPDPPASNIEMSADSESQAATEPNPPTQSQQDEAGPSTAKVKTEDCDVYEGDNLVPMVKMVKVDPIRCVARPNRVDMGHLKEVMLSIIRRAIEDKARGHENEQRSSVLFKDVLTELFNSDELQPRTREDLTMQMAFLCLLTLTNEHSFSLKQEPGEDVVISYEQNQF